MTDYSVGTGASSSLIIRDDGYTVSAIIENRSGASYSNGRTWSIYLGNGSSASGLFSIGRSSSVTVWSGVITTSMSVQFNMGATGTSGIGGPTTLNVNIFRATIPSPPQSPSFSEVSVTSLKVNFAGSASDGGSGLDYYLVRVGKSNPPTAGTYTDLVTPTGTGNLFTGLDPGAEYYAVVYAHNAVGYSAASAVIGTRTLGPARIKVAGVWKYGIPYVKVAGVWKLAQPFVKVAGLWKKTG